MPKPLFVLFALVLALGLVDIVSMVSLLVAEAGRSAGRPAWNAALIGNGLGLLLCAYGIYAKRTEVRWFLPLLLLTVAGAFAFVAIFTPGLGGGFTGALIRVVYITGSKVALTIVAVMIFGTQSAKDYFASGRGGKT